jgi:hypothetical protein
VVPVQRHIICTIVLLSGQALLIVGLPFRRLRRRRSEAAPRRPELRHRFPDGPLVPRPGVNLILYYGVLGARAGWRPEVVRRSASAQEPAAGDFGPAPDTARRRAASGGRI